MNALARSALPILLTAVGLAQDATAQEIRFESGVTNIHVDALVRRNGKIVRGLMRDDLVVRDEGESRPLVAFAEEPVPLDLVLLVDASAFNGPGPGSWSETLKVMFAGASNAFKQLRPNDRCAIVSTVGPHLEQDLTADPKAIAAALKRARRVGLGDRHLGIQWAGRLLQADAKARGPGAAERKRAILMLTHVEPPVSRIVWKPDEPVIQQLWSMDIALHVIAAPVDFAIYAGEVNPARLDKPQHIAKATGGDVVRSPQDIPDLVARIQSSYSLWYRAPVAKHGELRHVSVELSDDAKKKYPGAEIRAREGYIVP